MMEITATERTEVRRPIVAGAQVATSDQEPVIYPFDGSEIGTVSLADEDAIERALASAAAAEPEIGALPPFARAAVLMRAGEIVAARREELARQMTLETGIALRESLVDAERTAEILTLAGEEARRAAAAGEIVPLDAVARGEGRFGVTKRFPVGTVLGITAFNAPLVLVAHKIAPAFASGCPCIIKPAPKTPLSALSLGEIMLEAGMPPAALSVVPTTNDRVEKMVMDRRVKMISFTGSDRVGWHIKKNAATPRVTLELGGNGAVIVHSDADLDHAAARCAIGGFARAGQACNSVQRLYVHESVWADFSDKFIARASTLKPGDPLDASTTLGGMISEAVVERTMAMVEDVKAHGGKVLIGGTHDGTLMEPTVVTDVPEQLTLCSDEIFAPIVVLLTYRDLEDALDRANDSRFGLQTGIFTRDIRVILAAFQQLEVGAVIVNDVNGFRLDQMPYGGVKESGYGREGIRYAMDEMTEPRLLAIHPGELR